MKRTVCWFRPEVFLPILGWWEVAIGLCLLFRPLTRPGIFLLFLQMPGTFLLLVLLPEGCFQKFPAVLTMEGQSIVKNLIIIGAAFRASRLTHKSICMQPTKSQLWQEKKA